MSETIYFNGQKYDGIGAMPPDIRRNYERVTQLLADTNGNGKPDILEIHSFGDLKRIIEVAEEIGKTQTSVGEISGADPARIKSQTAIIRETNRGIYVNGKFYETPEDMPQDVFEIYDAAVTRAADAPPPAASRPPGDEASRQAFFEPHDDEIFSREISPSIPQDDPVSENVDTTARFLIVLIAAFMLLGIIIPIAWVLFF